jgi:hypothetical protein
LEHVAVEVDACVVVPRVELEPPRRAGLVPDLEAGDLIRLPGADAGAAGVADDREGAVLRDLHRLHVDPAPLRRAVLRGALDVVGREVGRPHVRLSLLAGVRHTASDVLAVLQEREVAAELLTLDLGRPAEEPAVELGGLLGVRAVEIDPAGCADYECWRRH